MNNLLACFSVFWLCLGAFAGEFEFAEKVVRGENRFPVSIVTNASGHLLVDFGKHIFGWIEADVSQKGDYVFLWGEQIDAAGSVQTNAFYTQKEGRIRCACTCGSFATNGWTRIPYEMGNNSAFNDAPTGRFGTVMPFRWLEIAKSPFSITARNVRQVPIHYPYDMAEESFDCDSAALVKVHDFCKHSVRATTYTGKFVDGDRERLPYEADSFITQLSTYAMTSDHTLVRAMADYLATHPTWPTEWKQFFICIIYADWRYSGKTDIVHKHYERMKRDKLWLHLRRPDGLLVTRGPAAKPAPDGEKPEDIVDWAMCYRDGFEMCDVNTVVNALHIRNLREMSEMARAIGRTDDAKVFVKMERQTFAAFQKCLWNSEQRRYRDGEGSSHATVQGNAMALACGAVPAEREKAVSNYVVQKGFSCSTYMAQFVLDALFLSGRAREALALLTADTHRSWLGMMAKGATITPEFWDLTMSEDGRIPDMNHAWTTSPLNVISRFVLGVTPAEPGFVKASVKPQPGGLNRIEGVVPTPKGPISVKLVRQEGFWQVELETPVPTAFSFAGYTRELSAGRHVFAVELKRGFPWSSATFGGRAVELRAVRLSAVPFNQTWPGYQRPRTQTKRGVFVQFDVTKADWLALDFKTEDRAVKAQSVCRIRPLSRINLIRREGSRLLVEVPHPEQFVMEFPGLADDLHVFADPPFVRQHATDEIYFGPGVHQAGLIRPKSGQTVCLAPGAYVYGSIFAADVSDVRVVGRGVLDSSQMVRLSGDGKVLDNQMNNLRIGKGAWDIDSSSFTAISVTNLTVEGITLVDAPFWAVILRECEDVTMDNVKIVGQWRYNADGIDVCDSRKTAIRNSFVRSFDDCIVARGCQLNDEGRELDGLDVDNCVLWCDWGKNLEVWGSWRRGAIRNVAYRNCKCINPSQIVCDVTLQGGQGDIVYENIAFENIEVDLVRPHFKSHLQNPDSPDARYPGGTENGIWLAAVGCNGAGGRSVTYRNISLRNIRAFGDEEMALVAFLHPKDLVLKTDGVVFENLPKRTDVR